MGNKPQTDAETEAVREQCQAALDDLTASLAQVLKAVNRVNKAVGRLGGILEGNPKTRGAKKADQKEASQPHSDDETV